MEKKPLNVSSSFEHLITCLRHNPPDTQRAFLKGLSAAEWRDTCACAKNHALTPNLFHALKPFESDLFIAEKIWAKLRGDYFKSAARNVRFYKKLEEILLALNQENISVALLKGIHLAEYVYGNLALRGMADIDILVKEQDLTQADVLLQASGAQPLTLGNRQQKGDSGKHFSYVFDADGIHVELHWKPISGNFAEMDTLWSRMVTAQAGAVKALVLSPEDLLTHLCLHSAEHLHELRLRMVYDLATILSRYGDAFNWSRTMKVIKEWEAETACYAFLSLTRDFFGTHVPEEVLLELKSSAADDEILSWIATLFKRKNERRYSRLPTPGVSLWWETKGIRAKAGILFRRLVPSAGKLSAMYGVPTHAWRLCFYYPRYLRDLTRGRIKVLFGLVAGNQKTKKDVRQVRRTELIRRKLLHRS